MSRRGLRPVEVCECGTPRRPGEPSCQSCRWLDGETSSEAAVVAMLRSEGGRVTLPVLRERLGLVERTLLRALARLCARGRVRSTCEGAVRHHGDQTPGTTPAHYELVERRLRRREVTRVAA